MKRVFDIISSLVAIFLLSPILIITSVAIKKDSVGPILFKQQRPGLKNRLFTIYKFRSMYMNTPNVETTLLGESDNYITPVGKFIRKSSIDELPQLLNVVKGDMSLVGPRPALYNQYKLIEERTKLGVDKVKPGITGFAQVMGRDNITDEQKIQYDKYYVDNQSLKLDIWIIVKTIKDVLLSKGVKH